MKVDIYELNTTTEEPELVGSVIASGASAAEVSPELRFLDDMKIFVSSVDGQLEVQPSDGRQYLVGLLQSLRGSYMWAALDPLE